MNSSAPSTDTRDHGGVEPAFLDRDSELRFLLIEDSTSDSEFVRALLTREFPRGGLDVATRLAEALRYLAETDYDLVLADLNLPDADGDAVVRAVREASPQTALLVLTGRADTTLALTALAEGAQDYLVKGEKDGPHLAEALLHVLQRSRTEQLARSRLMAALELESEASDRLRELNLAKDEFVGTTSHELRTPLTSIAGHAELLHEEGGLTERQAAHVDVIVRNAARLAALTEDLLLVSASASKRQLAEPVPVDLRAVASSAQEVVASLASVKDLAVSFELASQPVLVAGDARALERVVLNLMSNAIKFTENGGTVICRLSSTSTDAVLTVIDTGLGIPLSEQAHLFDRFFRAEAARERAIEGTGLGLHIAASIVRDHGGAISVDSVPDRGSTFTTRLPLLSVTTQTQARGMR